MRPHTIAVPNSIGYRLFCAGVDVVFLRTLSAQKLSEFRQAVQKHKKA